MNKVLFFQVIIIVFFFTFYQVKAKKTVFDSKESILKSGNIDFVKTTDSVNIEEVTFNKKKIKINMSLDNFYKNYPKAIYKSIKKRDSDSEDGYINEPRYYFTSKNYVYADKLVFERNKKVLEIFIGENGSFLDGCNAMVGDSISQLKTCFKNSYKRDVENKIKVTSDIRKKSLIKNQEILFVKINYSKQSESPLSLLYWWDTKTFKIVRIETKYQ